MANKQIGIVTVHGTGDTAAGPDGEKWFQNGSAFATRLKARLAAQGLDAAIIPFLWSGANSARAREDASRKLVRRLRKAARAHGPVHVIGHSHGGNVANEAARMIRWRPKFDMMSFLLNPLGSLFRGRDKIASVTTVGTPFFRSKLSSAESFGGVAFLLLLIASTLALAVGGIFLAALLAHAHRSPDQVLEDMRIVLANTAQAPDATPPTEEQLREYAANDLRENINSRPGLYLVSTIYLAFVAPLIFIYPVAVSGLARIVRLRRKQNMRAKVHSIWHPHDEAIAFLQRVEKMPLEPFPRGALWRTSRTAGIVWGVRIVNLMVLAGLILLIAGTAGLDFPAQFKTDSAAFLTDIITATSDDPEPVPGGGVDAVRPDEIHPSIVGAILVLLGVVGMPLVFGAIYVVTRLLVFGLGLELGLRGSLNNAVGGVLKGIAFGRDGDERVGDVATQSHCHGSQCTILEGEVADRMQQRAGAAADKLIEKYRWALFSVGGNDNSALEALATDAMTWDSLIHTTYFDQPEIVDMIADYIVAQERAIAEGGKARETRTAEAGAQLGPLAPPGLRPHPAEGGSL
ncbi:MAG TPA: hypothetical protein VEF55_00295 [Candidatus Binatia bacterium]|nr:hypothetical protein [Candidatus Binatia bacterium]